MEIWKGDRLKVKGETYDVLNVLSEFDKWDEKTNQPTDWHTMIELHSDSIKNMFASHIIKIYEESDKIVLCKIIYRPREGKPRNMPRTFSSTTYEPLEELQLSDITKI